MHPKRTSGSRWTQLKSQRLRASSLGTPLWITMLPKLAPKSSLRNRRLEHKRMQRCLPLCARMNPNRPQSESAHRLPTTIYHKPYNSNSANRVYLKRASRNIKQNRSRSQQELRNRLVPLPRTRSTLLSRRFNPCTEVGREVPSTRHHRQNRTSLEFHWTRQTVRVAQHWRSKEKSPKSRWHSNCHCHIRSSRQSLVTMRNSIRRSRRRSHSWRGSAPATPSITTTHSIAPHSRNRHITLKRWRQCPMSTFSIRIT